MLVGASNFLELVNLLGIDPIRNLGWANLINANLEGTNFDGATVERALFGNNKGLTQ